MHHQRRRSGHGSGHTSANTSTTDVRKAVTVTDLSAKHRTTSRPVLSRRNTPQKLGKNPRDREKEWEEERWFDGERESFPMYCMTCEKEFTPQDGNFLYCSDECRATDQNTSTIPAIPCTGRGPYVNYPNYSGHSEPRDIIPRASPSRPDSLFACPPSPPDETSKPTPAISALRSISIRPPSPPSPTTSSYWPFTRSAATSPSSSYSRPVSGVYSTTYDDAHYAGAGYASAAMDRPLPARRPAGTYSRPKSIDLVTPMFGR